MVMILASIIYNTETLHILTASIVLHQSAGRLSACGLIRIPSTDHHAADHSMITRKHARHVDRAFCCEFKEDMSQGILQRPADLRPQYIKILRQLRDSITQKKHAVKCRNRL